MLVSDLFRAKYIHMLSLIEIVSKMQFYDFSALNQMLCLNLKCKSLIRMVLYIIEDKYLHCNPLVHVHFVENSGTYASMLAKASMLVKASMLTCFYASF